MSGIYIFFTKSVDRTTTRLDPNSIPTPIVRKRCRFKI